MTDLELKKLYKNLSGIDLTDSERKKKDGSFISLPSGITHYQLSGEGEAVVLVHGYATPYFLYDKIYEGLIKEGYKVLRYDLLGRGLSERVNADYTPELFAKQLYELTQALFGNEKFYLFGTSMGGTVTASFCRIYPGFVKKLVLLAPAGMDSFKPPFYMKITSAPVLGDIIFSKIGCKVLLKKCASELKYVSQDEKDYFIRSFAYNAQYKGMEKCTLSSLRNTILKTKHATEMYKSVNEQNIPMLVIWGTDDKTMPYYQMERMKSICKNALYETFEGSGHIFLFDEGERTLEKVIPFIKAK